MSRYTLLRIAAWQLAALFLTTDAALHAAEPLVPGTGKLVAKAFDDFEDPAWKYKFNWPKSSDNLDSNVRTPAGASINGRWFESALRGQPDVIERVATPEGGISGSTGSLLLRSLNTGVPKRPSREGQQDDLIINARGALGGAISVSRAPSAVVRVFLPPFEEWENRTGNSFGFRASVEAPKKASGWRRGSQMETYWPGIFIYFESETDRRFEKDSAKFLLRAGPKGHDFPGPEITETGWWTLGMSFTHDGQVHYYVRQGVEDLTAEDHVGSQFPYGFRAQRFKTFFFNVANFDDGKSWSTPWVIDDPALYLAR